MLTKKELSEITKISMPQIDRLRALGMPYMKIGKSVRFDEAKVMEWFAKHNIEEMKEAE